MTVSVCYITAPCEAPGTFTPKGQGFNSLLTEGNEGRTGFVSLLPDSGDKNPGPMRLAHELPEVDGRYFLWTLLECVSGPSL